MFEKIQCFCHPNSINEQKFKERASPKHPYPPQIQNISFFSVSVLMNYILKHPIAQAWSLGVIVLFPLLTLSHNQLLITVKFISCPDGLAQLVEASSCTPEGCRFILQWGCIWEAEIDFSLSLYVSLCLCLCLSPLSLLKKQKKINEYNPQVRI